MNLDRTLTGIAAAAVVAFVAGACGSSTSNDVPEENSGEGSPNYASTSEGGETSNSSRSTGRSKPGARSRRSRSRKGDGEPPKATGPVAHVDGEPVPAKAFNEEIAKVTKTGKYPPSLLDKFTGRLIDRLVDRHLVDCSIAKANIQVSKNAVDEKLKKVRKEFDEAAKKKGETRSLEQVAKKYGISKKELRESVRRSIAIEKLLVDRGMKRPTKKDVRKYYDDNKDQFTRPRQVEVQHILVKVGRRASDKEWKKAKEKIRKIRKKAVSDGTKFGDLARKKSDGPSSKKGGKIGFISKRQLEPVFVAADDQKKGAISKPVRSKYGWHIVKTLDKRKSKTVPLKKVRGKLKEKIKNKRIQKHLQKFIDRLRKKAKVEKHPENVE